MAGLSVGGLGSGLDVAGMTQQLVAAERTPKEIRITNEKSKVDASLSAYGLVKSSASSLQDMFESFDEDEVFSSKEASSSESGYLGVTVESNAQNGRYSVEVKQLAETHKIASDSLTADPDASLGSGDLVIGVGSNTMTISIAANKSSLKDVAQAINDADDNPGITATIITDDSGAKLVFSSTKTGESNKISIDASGATGDLADLGFDPDNITGNAKMHEMQEAKDAVIVIDGFSTVTNSTNTFTDAIEGVTLDAKKITGTYGTGTDTDDIEVKNAIIEIENDTAKPKSAIDSFVEAYNSLFEMVDSQSKYNVEEESGGPLVGDSVSRSLLSQLRNLLNEPVEVNGTSYLLSDFGVTTDRYGKLEVDDEILEDQLDNNFLSFGRFFNGDDGFLKKADDLLDGFVGREGTITSREDSLKEQQSRLDDDLDTLNERMKAYEERMYKQLSAMDAAIYKMNNELSTMMSMLVF